MKNMSEEEIAKGILDFQNNYPHTEYTKESLIRNVRQNNKLFGKEGNKDR